MRWFRTRSSAICIGIFLLMVLLISRLFQLSVMQEDKWSAEASILSIKSITTAAPRGDIMDRHGRLLAGSRASFVVQFSEGSMTDEELNRQSLLLINILEQNGEEINDNLPIVMENGQFIYTYDKQVQEWLASQDMEESLTAEQAFNELRERNDIDEGLDKYEAQEELLGSYNMSPPISVARMKFTYELEKEKFIGRYYPKKDDQTEEEAYGRSAEDIFRSLRGKFEIDENLSDADARKILVVRNELHAQGYMSYLPAKIASGLSDETIITLEEKSNELSGSAVSAEPERYYPYESTAAHVLGYLGKISESQLDEYKEKDKDYSSSDIVGQQGIESKFEDVLRGKKGVKNVEVNVLGEAVRVINEELPERGKDVYLTIDLELQQAAEEALERTLETLQRGGSFESRWGNYKFARPYPNANVGAIVAIDVKTGEVLAMASYPAYDPNLFVNGISKEDWNSLQSKNPRDPLSPLPLYNVATKTTVQPGSTFKMVTAIAALENGLNPNLRYRDRGEVMIGNRGYKCVSWNLFRSTHGALNLYEAMEVSCNYYFYNLSTGVDYANGKASLGIGPMGVDVMADYARQFGLGVNTGIEIDEAKGSYPEASQQMDASIRAIKNMLIGSASRYFEEDIAGDIEKRNEVISEIAGWAEEDPSRNELIERLIDVGVKEDMAASVADRLKYTYFRNIDWSDGDTLIVAIGQGVNSYSPLQMANYTATIGNGGVRNQVNVVRAVEGQGLTEKPQGEKVNISSDAYLDDVIEGMRRVAHGSKGSAKNLFQNFPVQVAAKTGTAERGGSVPPPDEVEYFRQNLHWINGNLTFDQVEEEMQKLLREDPDTFKNENGAVRQAVVNLLRDAGMDREDWSFLDRNKAAYEDYAWFVAMAPVEEPEIAVAAIIFQGGTGGYAGVPVREVIGHYLGFDDEYEDFSLRTEMLQ